MIQDSLSLIEIKETHEFDQILNEADKPIGLYFYGDFSETSKQMRTQIESIAKDSKEALLFSVNVSQNKDLHKKYNVKNVPTMVLFRNKQAVDWIQGQQSTDFIKNILQGNTVVRSIKNEEGSKTPQIVVYTTPTCHFCTKIKNHLRKLGFPYREVDIAKDSKAGEDLVKKTGQTGVPQTFINGQLVMGFDQQKIDRLLGVA